MTVESNYAIAIANQPTNCIISSRGGQGKSLQILGLATTDLHSQKVHTKLQSPQVWC